MSRRCKNCDRSIAKKHANAKFCGNRCKDDYHNRTNPRGYGAQLSGGVDPYVAEDPGWDAHKGTF